MRSSAGPFAAAIALFLGAIVTLPAMPRAAMAQTAASDAASDGADFRTDVLLATPDQVTPVPQDNLIATAPGAKQAVEAKPPHSQHSKTPPRSANR